MQSMYACAGAAGTRWSALCRNIYYTTLNAFCQDFFTNYFKNFYPKTVDNKILMCYNNNVIRKG